MSTKPDQAQSVRLDASYAAAHAGLSHAWWWRGIWGATTFKQVESPSRVAAVKAVELDPGLPEAHVSAGRIKFGHEWDWSGAREAFTRALAIDPNNVDAHFFSAMLCMALGCFSEAIDHMERIEERDPLSATVQSFFGRVLYRARRYDDAIVHLNRAIELDPQSPAGAYGRLADVYEAVGKYDEALMLLEKGARIEGRPSSTGYSARSANLCADGQTETSDRNAQWIARRQPAPVGDDVHSDRRSRQSLPIAVRDHRRSPFDVYVKTDPAFDRLHSDPRWQEVLRRMYYPTETPAGSPDSPPPHWPARDR